MSFAASQVLGIPVSIAIANKWDWNAPFLAIVLFAVPLGLLLLLGMRPVNAHLALQSDKNALTHLWHTLREKKYQTGFITSALLPIGGFMLMPFSSAFAVNNLGVSYGQLPYLFMITGIGSIIIMPLVGRMSDRYNKLKLFFAGSAWASVFVVIYTNLTPIPFWQIIALNVLLFMGIMSRIVPATALVTAIPEMKDRGAFMSVNALLQQIAGGIASLIAGFIVVQQTETSPVEHFDTLGYVVLGVMIAGVYAVMRVDRIIRKHGAN